MSGAWAFPLTSQGMRPLLSMAAPPPRNDGRPAAKTQPLPKDSPSGVNDAGAPSEARGRNSTSGPNSASSPTNASGPNLAIGTDADTDARLVARVVADDDRRAYAVLVERHQSSVRNLLRRLTRNDQALADDLAQETFIQVYRNLHQFRGEARFSTWIYRIAYNAFLADARGRHETEPLPDDIDAAAGYASDPAPLARTAALRLDLERALAKLSTPERDALIHCYYLDLSHEEAAYVLQCPLGTVKTNVLRGRQKLKALLAAWAPEER
jgi:RNA polymerase sigma factor (sigma-70 family)